MTEAFYEGLGSMSAMLVIISIITIGAIISVKNKIKSGPSKSVEKDKESEPVKEWAKLTKQNPDDVQNDVQNQLNDLNKELDKEKE